MADDPLTDCVHCEEGHVRRVVNSVGIVFKGSGFYVTDNRNGKGKTKTNGSGANGDSPSSNGKSAETAFATESKKESKPKAAKEPTKAAV